MIGSTGLARYEAQQCAGTATEDADFAVVMADVAQRRAVAFFDCHDH